ncbi:RNA cap guanine-N2 methyltransferase [Aureococcus anophagefferens]|nr:RNA cap guanine-N2 methyltransferase [Aureococcus anophagefferens]
MYSFNWSELFDSACKPDAPYSTQGSGDGGDDDLGIDFEDAWDATGATASTRPQAYSEAFSDDSVHRASNADADKFLLSPGSTGDLTRMGLKEYHSPYFNTEKRSVVAQRADGERETVRRARRAPRARPEKRVSMHILARPLSRWDATARLWRFEPGDVVECEGADMRWRLAVVTAATREDGAAVAAYRRWLRDERNGAFAARYDRSPGARQALKDLLIEPFRRIAEAVGDWEFEAGKASTYLYLACMGSGLLSVLATLLLQCGFPAVVLMYTLYAGRSDGDVAALCSDRAASVDAKGHGARFTKAAIELVVVLYLVKVIPDSYHKFFFPSHSKDGVDRLISIRRSSRKEADTVLMKIGYRLHTFMNSAFEVLLYSLNMYLLFYHDSPLEVILNSLMIEFILDLDEYLADSPHIDTNFRYLRSAAVEMEGREARNDDAVDASLQEYYGEKDVERYGLFARFGQRHGIGHWKKGIFNRYASYRTGEALPRWLEILFKPGDAHHYEKALATSVPYGTLEGFQVEGVRTLRRFIEHNAPGLVATINAPLLGDVLKTATCQRIWSAIRGYNGDGEPLVGCGKARRCLVVVDALRVRDRVGVALRVPVTALAVSAWVPLCYGPYR